MATEPQPRAQASSGAPKIEYIDRLEPAETFADSIQSVSFDGQSLRINFCVTRLDDFPQNQPPNGKRYSACRLVLPPIAAVDLINQMQRISAALTQAGILKPTPAQPAPDKKN